MNIGDASAASGVSTTMIRYYESRGLIDPVRQTSFGRRIYSIRDVHMLDFIRRSRELGLKVAEIADLLALWQFQNTSSGELKVLATEHIRLLSARAAMLEAVIDAVIALAGTWGQGDRKDYPVLRCTPSGLEPALNVARTRLMNMGRGH